MTYYGYVLCFLLEKARLYMTIYQVISLKRIMNT